MRRRLLPVALLVLAAGCGGGGGDEADVRDALRTFSQAAIDGDGGTACDGLAKATRDKLRLGAKECDEVFESVSGDFKAQAEKNIDEIDDLDVKIDGDTATVSKDGESTKLIKEDGSWKLTEG